MTLKYEIKFYDYWHLSSGLSAGAKLDSTVTKDKDGIPYIPARTIKGLLREMAEDIDCDFTNRCFGYSSDKKDKCYDEEHKGKKGECYFANATLDEKIAKEIVSNKLQDNLYDIITSTKVGSNGIAEDKSLRDIEVVIPLTLKGEILDVELEDDKEKLINSMKLIKRMGLNRNRGLGRCEFIDFVTEEQK